MGKKKKAAYATTKFDSGAWGTSTNGAFGTTYSPDDWMNQTMGTVQTNLNPTLQSLLNNDYTQDKNFQAYQNNFNRQAQQAYDTNVLGQLANRGLMRSSGLQAATNAFNDTLTNNEMNLYDQYYNRQLNNLSQLLNTSNTLYNYMAGITGKNQVDTNNVNNFNLANKTDNSGLFGSLAGSVGSLAGSLGSAWINNQSKS